MEELIESYLLKNKICPLPSIGALQLLHVSAVALYSEAKIESPVPVIRLQDTSLHADDLIDFIASKRNTSKEVASSLLAQFCDHLQNMDAYGETKLPHAGKFYINADGNLVFKSLETPGAFLPAVHAERVVHANASHTMVVGDKETTTTEMAAYYADTEPVSKDRWWIWSICLALIAAAGLFLYLNNSSYNPSFGNSQQIEVLSSPHTYIIAE